MSKALARNLSAVELAKFASDELFDVALVCNRTEYLTELVERVEGLAIKADQLDALLDDTGFSEANDFTVYMDKVKDIMDEFIIDDIDELVRQLKALQKVMVEFDLVDSYDLDRELKRLKKLAQRIEEACIEAAIEVTF